MLNGLGFSAFYAGRPQHIAVKFHDALGTGLLMEIVHILGDYVFQDTPIFQIGHDPVRFIGARGSEVKLA
jgi:hypothetical protein